ncbi:MAG: nucleotidyltransferase family protein [Dinghuibacter sp.]|nr:nucleotidyltransferase family protein [Dinghuibacter sp.]
MKAMILAAGFGTRLKPFTDSHPKALFPVNGKPLLQRNVEYLQQYGITDVVVNVHHFAEQIVAAVEDAGGWGSRITISDETDAILETGGGLKKAAPLLNNGEAFVLMNADILTRLHLGNMIQQHRQQQPLATLAVAQRNSSRHFLLNHDLFLCGWENTATGEQKMPRAEHNGVQPFAFSGIHIIEPAIFPLIQREGKFSMVDVYLDLCGTHAIRGFDHTGERVMDVGKPGALEEAEKYFP